MTTTIEQLPAEVQDRNQEARFRRFKLEPTIGNRWRLQHPPSAYEDAAVKCEQRKHWAFAARMWILASCVSHGHKRADRYEQRAKHCAAQLERPLKKGDLVDVMSRTYGGEDIVEGRATIVGPIEDVKDYFKVRFVGDRKSYPRFVQPSHRVTA